MNTSKDRENSQAEEPVARMKIKLLKNSIQIGGVRYKVNLSFVILCEWMAEYVKAGRILSHIFDRSNSNNVRKRVLSVVYDKLFDLV
jgi:hypothetical protein